MRKRTTTFTKGSGCYTCTMCGRKTRDDGNGDSVHCGLCSQCYEYSGLENEMLDYEPGYSTTELNPERMEELRKEVLSKGGNDTYLRYHLRNESMGIVQAALNQALREDWDK